MSLPWSTKEITVINHLKSNTSFVNLLKSDNPTYSFSDQFPKDYSLFLLKTWPHLTPELLIFQRTGRSRCGVLCLSHIQSYPCRHRSSHSAFGCSGVNLAPALKSMQLLWIGVSVSRLWSQCIFFFIKSLKHFESPQVKSTERNIKYINSYWCAHFHR